MTIRIDYLDDGLGILLTGAGTIVGQDLIRANQEIFSSVQKMKKYRYGIIDWSEATGKAIATSEIEFAVNQDKAASKYMPDIIVAVVADNEIKFGLSRMWETFIDMNGLNWETMVFRTRDEAERWIKDTVKTRFQLDVAIK